MANDELRALSERDQTAFMDAAKRIVRECSGCDLYKIWEPKA